MSRRYTLRVGAASRGSRRTPRPAPSPTTPSPASRRRRGVCSSPRPSTPAPSTMSSESFAAFRDAAADGVGLEKATALADRLRAGAPDGPIDLALLAGASGIDAQKIALLAMAGEEAG